jgi:DNA-binding response OmpR family regulator
MNRTPLRIPVLVIEEDDDLRESIRYNLYLDGFEVYTASDGPSGIETASKCKLRLILLDVKDGLEVLSTLKQDPQTGHIPVIMLTSKSLIADTDQASEFVADDYITKPFEDNRLGKTVKQKLKKCENATRKKRRSNKIPVLVIDDDDSWLKAVEYNLCSEGFEAYTAADGPSGIEAALKHKPRLILLDIMMPEMDGLEVLSTLKHDSRTRRIPVFMLTAKTALGDIDRAFDIGAADYITKPLEGNKLGKTIKKKLKKCEAATSKTRRLKRIPVLIIDDDAVWRKVVEHNLYVEGYQVYTAVDGPSGIEAALKYKPRLILLDVMMPGMDGLEVLSKLKHNPRTSRIPVIMLTSKNLVADIDRAFDIGADDYITKPFEGVKLTKAVKENVEKHRKRLCFLGAKIST